MYAVIETGGKQYRVEYGKELHVELLDATPGSEVTFDRVLLVRTDDATQVGAPIVSGAKVTALVVGQERGVKSISFKYRPKARSRIMKGHRQELHLVRISEISFGGVSAKAAAEKIEGARAAEAAANAKVAAERAKSDAALAAKLNVAPAESDAPKAAAKKPASTTAAAATKPVAAKPAAKKPAAKKPATKKSDAE
ncbi:MAG: 50S ribosomal protein L21 [Candidatus Limnocylindrus sp.]